MKQFQSALIVLIIAAFVSCSAIFGEEFERIPINKISTSGNLHMGAARFDLQKGEEISLWADFDVEYDGGLELEYQIVIVVDEKDTLDMLAFDPFEANVTMNSKSITINRHHEYSAEAKLATYEADETGSYEFNVVVFASRNPDEFTFNKGDLVFRK